MSYPFSTIYTLRAIQKLQIWSKYYPPLYSRHLVNEHSVNEHSVTGNIQLTDIYLSGNRMPRLRDRHSVTGDFVR